MRTADNIMKPPWLNVHLFPFRENFFPTPEGRMHYVDEGEGEVIVIVHGTPSWSFEYREIIKGLSKKYRVVVPDHLGFGLSEKPPRANYRPEAHARRLELLLESIGISSMRLMVHDFGGPIGLSYALKYTSKVRQLVISNTFCYPLDEYPYIRQADRVFNNWVGRFLYQYLNFSPRFLLKMAFHDPNKLTQEIHRHYREPFPHPRNRKALFAFVQALIGEREWYRELWSTREKIAHIPALFLWGMADKFFPPEHLEKMQSIFLHRKVVRLEDVGHFPAEEAPEKCLEAMEAFF